MPKEEHIFISKDGKMFELVDCDIGSKQRFTGACTGCYFSLYTCISKRMEMFSKDKFPMCYERKVFKLISGI